MDLIDGILGAPVAQRTRSNVLVSDKHPLELPSSRELGALFQDALYERTGLQAIYAGEALTGIAALDRQAWIAFEGAFSGAWRLRWDSAMEAILAATAPSGQKVSALIEDVMEASIRRWSVRQQSLGPLIMGGYQSSPPNGVGPNPGPGSSASLSVQDTLVEVCLFNCGR